MPSKIHIPAASWDRRKFLTATGTALAWPFLAPPRSAIAKRNVKLKDDPFTLGVASGDPSSDGFVLWTRLAPEPLTGGGMPDDNVEVDWQVATDEAMSHVVARGTAIAAPQMAHSVHIEVAGLEPNRWYWYQFSAAGAISPKGRARSLPRPSEVPDRLRFAFASCQHYEYGYYTAYEHMARENLDLVVHLGDYIYEGASKRGAVRQHVGGSCKSLEDYRNRYAQYQTDKLLQAAQAACPWIVTWDDHEVQNNYADDISQDKDIDQATFLSQRADAYRAYYEHMPLRRAQFPHGPDARLYRRTGFGRLVEFAVLDTRQYRSDQPCGDGEKPPCEEVFDPKRTMLGDDQEQWLYATLRSSPARWNVLAQQVMMARVNQAIGGKPAYYLDTWAGYEANRQRILRFLDESGVANPMVITGDFHANWVNDLQIDSDKERSPVVATEFVGTSISSGGDGKEVGKHTEQVLADNPFVRFNNHERGYVTCEVTPSQWTSHFRVVEYVERLGAPVLTRRSFVVEDGRRGAKVA